MIDLYDHEVAGILRIQQQLISRARQKSHNYGDFEREITGRFAEAGFAVAVSWYTYEIDGVPQEGAVPEVTITGRTAPVAFDPDRQVHEAVHDVLGLGEEGWITTDPQTLRRFLGGHGHRH